MAINSLTGFGDAFLQVASVNQRSLCPPGRRRLSSLPRLSCISGPRRNCLPLACVVVIRAHSDVILPILKTSPPRTPRSTAACATTFMARLRNQSWTDVEGSLLEI